MLLGIVYVVLYFLAVLVSGIIPCVAIAMFIDESTAKTYARVHCWVWEIVIIAMALSYWNPLNIAIG